MSITVEKWLLFAFLKMNKQGQVTPQAIKKQIDILVIESLAPKLNEIGAKCIEKGQMYR